ncbi:MAG: hypothetical protein ACPGOY_16165 [Rhodospirillaceae bacterium]
MAQHSTPQGQIHLAERPRPSLFQLLMTSGFVEALPSDLATTALFQTGPVPDPSRRRLSQGDVS